MNIFSARNILKHYPRSKFKLNVDQLDLPENSITGVVGENGNGKTTLLNIVAGELQSSGDFNYFNHHEYTSWSSRKDFIGFIPQRIPKWHGTLEQNLYLKAAIEGISSQFIDQELNELLDFLDLQKFRHLKWTEISTGYRLRFELARVLLGKPRLLVLDEPLANLDINTQQKFLSDLKTLLSDRSYPIAMLLSSQQLHEIESVADQMLFLKSGHAVYSGGIDNISDNKESNLIEIQFVDADLEKIATALGEGVDIDKVGAYYQIKSDQAPNETLKTLMNQGFELKYFRDLTNSTKRFFND